MFLYFRKEKNDYPKITWGSVKYSEERFVFFFNVTVPKIHIFQKLKSRKLLTYIENTPEKFGGKISAVLNIAALGVNQYFF